MGQLNFTPVRDYASSALDLTPEQAAVRIAELEAALSEAAEHAESLERALASRDVIGQAKGIIMQRTGKDADKAFADLVALSQQTNQKLRLVAERIAQDSG